MTADEVVQSACEIAREILARDRSGEGHTHRTSDSLRADLDLELGREGRDPSEVLELLARILAATPSSGGPRFLNQLFGGRIPVATAAEMLTPLVNSSMYTFKVAGPQILIETEVTRRMTGLVGYTDGEGILGPGGSLSNLTALLIARNAALDRSRENGVGGRDAAVYTSEASHYSIRKSAGMLGIGRRAVRALPTDAEGAMQVEALRAQIEADRRDGVQPILINATAGTTVVGAFDPIREIAEIAREFGIWLHVDAAFGGGVLFSDEHRHLIDGCELSDSFTWCAHKMMGVPLSCSAILLRRRGQLARAFDETAEYLFQGDDDALNPGTRSIQCGRRNDALKLWAAWKQLGDEGFAERARLQFALAARAAALIEADPELVLLRPPRFLNILFEVRDKPSDEICRRLDQEGRLKIGYGDVDGRRAIRLVCVNPDLDESDLLTAFREIKDVASRL